MNYNVATKSASAVGRPSLRTDSWPSDGPEKSAPPRLTMRAAMMVSLLLSLGLWAAIWVVVASLASAVLG